MNAHRGSFAAVGFALVCVDVTAAAAQSLGDVARREQERRRQTPLARVYTNADLLPVDPAATPIPAVPPPAGSDAGAASPAPDSAAGPDPAPLDSAQPATEPAVKPREHRDERYWRTRAQDLRARLAKATAEVERAEAALEALEAGTSSPATSRERQVVGAAVARLRADAQARLDDVRRLEARAQVEQVPAEWTQ
jgi:hypothetical protein